MASFTLYPKPQTPNPKPQTLNPKQGIGIAKAVVSLTLFHEGRMLIARLFRERNKAAGLIPAT